MAKEQEAQEQASGLALTHATVRKGIDLEVGRAIPADVVRSLRLTTSESIIREIRPQALGATVLLACGTVVEFPLCAWLIHTPTAKAEPKPVPKLRVRVERPSTDPDRPEPVIEKRGQMMRVLAYPGDNNDMVGKAGEVLNVRPEAQDGPTALLEFVIESDRPEDKGKPPYVLRRNVPIEHLEAAK